MSGNPITVFDSGRLRAEGRHAASPLTLQRLFDRYTAEGRHLPDGSLKTDRYLEHVRQTGGYLARFVGSDQLVGQLTPDRIHEYVVWRRRGGISKRLVGVNTIQRDPGMFKAALNWACQKYDGDRPLLTRHVLEKVRIPTEKDPKRPLIDRGAILGLLAVAPNVHPFLRLLILLAWGTGRRTQRSPTPRVATSGSELPLLGSNQDSPDPVPLRLSPPLPRAFVVWNCAFTFASTRSGGSRSSLYTFPSRGLARRCQ